jgi:uncharacterized protein (UPF0147 family)
MSETEEEKKKAIKDLHIALKALSQKNALPLRVRAMVLAAIEKIEGEGDEPTTIS